MRDASLKSNQVGPAPVANRLYCQFTVKAVEEERRIITGIATTPSTDRVGDIVEPEGATFTLPIPLLWHHDSIQPIGHVIYAKPAADGIEIRAQLLQTDSPPRLKNRLDEAWQSIKIGLVRGLSIGFSSIEHAFMENGGIHFLKWNWYELSAVTIPANVEATITAIKQIDTGILSASGQKTSSVRIRKPASVMAKTVKGEKAMNIEESIRDFEVTLNSKSTRMIEIMQKSGDEGRTLDASETEEYDALQDEITSISGHIKRLQDLQKLNIQKATAVSGGSLQGASDARAGMVVSNIAEKLPKGIEFARYAMCLGAAKGDLTTAFAISQKRYPKNDRIHAVIKAAVEAGTTTHATWALPLVEYNQFAGDFVEFLRPMSIIGKFGASGIPALRSIPFNVHVRGQTSGGTGYWVGQGAPKPLTKFDFEDIYMSWSKVANIAVLTEELLRFSNPSAEMLVRDSLAAALLERLDTDFVDPAVAEVANVSPASITNGVTPIASSGTDANAVRTDVQAAVTQFISANISLISGVWIMPATTALALSLMRNALGQREFPEITMMGGTFEGLPVIVSEYVPSDTSGALVILVNAQDIWLADDGQVVIDASREASLQMLDNPTNNSATATATTMVSMFQTNSVALRAERWINWKKRRAAAVSMIDNVLWSA